MLQIEISLSSPVAWVQNQTKIVIDKKRCPNTYREFSCYEYKQDKYGNFISEFPDANNHTIDAARYALNDLISLRRVKFISKSSIGVY